MKKRGILLVALILFVVLSAQGSFAQTPQVQGYLHTVDGQDVLHVWGTPYEMGFAQGYLLADEIMLVFEDYVMSLLPNFIYRLGHLAVPTLFELPDEYNEEVQGILDGMYSSGADIYLPILQRNLDAGDLIFGNALGDVGAMACSAVTAWGEATKSDPNLLGETAVARNLDWTLAGPNKFLLSESTLVTVYTPTAPDMQTVVSVSFPGFFSCLTCMNEQGVTAALNIAHNGVSILEINYAERYTPIGVTLRQALHQNGDDGRAGDSIYDVAQHVIDDTRSGAFVINLAQPLNRTGAQPGLVLEVDNAGAALRTTEDELGVPDDILLSSNHLRKLRSFDPCDRYQTLYDEVGALGGILDVMTMWELEGKVIQDYFLSTTAQTVYFVPSKREMGMAYTDSNAFSPQKPPTVLTWDEMTALPDGVTLPEYDDDDQAEPDAPNYSQSDSDETEDICCGS